MGDSYLRGSAITLLERFYAIDPVTQASTPANPDAVTFEVVDPDNNSTFYIFGVDLNVTNPEFGLFVCALDPQLPPGTYVYRVEGSGAVDAVDEGSFDVVESAVLSPSPSTVATPGPCSSWISGVDVAEYDPGMGVGSDVWLLDDVAYQASYLLYEMSGRQFPGVCEITVRPCRQPCGCWGGEAFGLSPYYWTTSWVSGAWFTGWRNDNGETCGCGNESYIRLSGYPVREILEVKIDGSPIDPSGYRLDERRKLIRMADLSTTPPTDRLWPGCQDLSLPDTEPGTYSVRYTYGANVPQAGKWAAAQMAAELWKAFPANQGECRLPSRVTRVARQGITMERLLPTADLLRGGQTGLVLVDTFIAMVNPTKARRRSAVWSPDVQSFARRVGQ